VQVLLKQALALSSAAALTASEHTSKETESGQLAQSEVQIQSLSTPASDPISMPSHLQRALTLALDRFGASPPSTISANLQALFNQTEVLALIQVLRQQLFQGGHTRSFQSLPPAESSANEPASTVQLDAVVRVLSGCVDAIGPLGFLGTVEHEDFIGNIVPDLATEITHTTQSLEDAAELQGILRETLRYEESIRKHQAVGTHVPSHPDGTKISQQPGTICTLYSETGQGQDSLQNGDALPLALKAVNIVSPIKVRKGGDGQTSRRSVREKSMLERRNKSQYSLERLVL